MNGQCRHMPVRYDNCESRSVEFSDSTIERAVGPTVYKAIRKVHKYTPILIFGGESSRLLPPRRVLMLCPRAHTYP